MFRHLGTPNEDLWPGVTEYPDYSAAFPKWSPVDLAPSCPQLDPLGVDLLTKFLIYEPSKRISARAALQHPFFNDLPQAGRVPQVVAPQSAATQAMQAALANQAGVPAY